MRKIVFSQHRAWGDEIMLTSGVRDFKILFPDITIGIQTKYPHFWEHNPHIDHNLKYSDEGVEYYHVGYPTISNCNNKLNHFTNAFLLDMIAQVNSYEKLDMDLTGFCMAYSNGRVGDCNPKLWEGDKSVSPFKEWRKRFENNSSEFLKKRGELFLTDKEKECNLIRDVYGFDRYWVIANGGKSDCTTKIWDWRKFQKVIDHFDGHIKFVSIGTESHILQKLNNTIDLTDKLSSRELLSLIYNAEGTVSGVSFLMHATAALPKMHNKPCVAIYGGREPQSFTSYEGHQILHTGISLACCVNGGCWESHITPKGKSTRLCNDVVLSDGKFIPRCMNMITSEDVIRAIEKYYSGNPCNLIPLIKKEADMCIQIKPNLHKRINILGSLSGMGGGEQSLIQICIMLRANGWEVNLYPWDRVHPKFSNFKMEKFSFKNGMQDNMEKEIPLLFYGNDQISDFCKEEISSGIVNNSSQVIIGINFISSNLPKSVWLHKKLKAVIFQNEEKKNEYKRAMISNSDYELISLYGAVDVDRFLQLYPMERNSDNLVILKHGTPDHRKYVTSSSYGKGSKIHSWQKHLEKERDIDFYKRLLSDISNISFEFMQAHREVVKAFEGEPRMVFHNWDDLPVEDFLRRGHIYLHRVSNSWRDQYPRSVAEALAVGLPILSEPRDGTMDRIVHGSTGMYCIDYDSFAYSIKLLKRKENLRSDMSKNAKIWARDNLDPKEWVNTLNRLLIK